MPNDADPQVRIKATIDASGAVAGAGQVVGAVEQIGAATEASAEKAAVGGAEVDASMLQSRREVRRLLEGILELSQGGTMALAGLAEEGYAAGGAFSAMLGPLAPIFTAITLISALAIPMFERWEEHQQKIADGKGGVDDYAAAWKNASDEIIAALEQIRQAQDAVTKKDEADLAAIKEKTELTDKQSKLDANAAKQKLEQQYLIASQNPDLTEDQRKQLKANFEAAKKDIDEGGTVHTAEANRQGKAEEYGGLQRMAEGQSEAIDANRRTLEQLKAIQQGARDTLAGMGIPLGDEGKPTKGFEDEMARRQQLASEAQTRYDVASDVRMPSYDPAEQAQAKKDLDDALKQVSDLQTLGKNAASGEELKTAQKNFDDAKKGLDDTLAKIPAALTEWNQAAQGADQAKEQKILDDKQAAITASQQKAADDEKFGRQQRDENLKKREVDTQTNAELDPGNKAIYDKMLAGMEVEKLENKLADLKKDKPKDLEGQSEISGEIRKTQADANVKGANDELKAATDSARQALEMHKDPALANALKSLGATAQNIAQLHSDLASAVNGSVKAIIERLISAENSIASLKNNHL